MKTPTNPPLAEMPQRRHSLYGSLTALAVGAVLLCGQSNAPAQWDNWDDGTDTPPPINWIHLDPIAIATGGASIPNTYDPTGGNYRLVADSGNDSLGLGQARVLSLAPQTYTDFYVSADIVNWDNNTAQAVAVAARVSDIGPGTTDGYGFGLANGGTVLPGVAYVRILRLENESTKDVYGSGPGGDCEMPIADLVPGKSYRMVFMGRGTELEGRFYELPNLTTPLAVIKGNTAGDAIQLTSGNSGVLAFGAALGQGADVTFDNYYASSHVPLTITDMVVKDNFDDGNDTSPPMTWTHYDPIFAAYPPAGPQNTWSFPAGAYRLQAATSPLPEAVGPARVGSIDETDRTDFRLSIDLAGYDNTMDMAFGFLAHVQDVGPGTTDAHAMTFQTPSDLDFDLIRVIDENPGPPGVTATNFSLSPQFDDIGGNDMATNKFRFVFTATGNRLRGLIYKLPELMNPLVDCVAVDTNLPALTHGKVALFGFDNSGGVGPVDVTFDNYSDTPISPPAVSVVVGSLPTGEVTITWPASNEGIWVLQSSSTIDGTWAEVTTTTTAGAAGKLVYDPATGKSTYTGSASMSTTANTFYRLKQLPTI
jgi:hypothetical protein